MQCEVQYPIYIGMPDMGLHQYKLRCNSLSVLVQQHQSVPNMTKPTGGEFPTNTCATYF